MTKNNTVSVVIPCYNGSEFLGAAIESVRAQTHPAKEILVIDDGSTDDSASIAESFGPTVRVLKQKNSGESVARNRGIEQAAGNWIAFLDADDIWEPDKLRQQLSVADNKTVCVHSNYYILGHPDQIRDLSIVPPETRYSASYISTQGLCPSTMLVRRDTPCRFPTWTRIGEDWIYQVELARHGQFRLVAEPLCGYRRHDASQSGADKLIALNRHVSAKKWLVQQGPAMQVSEKQAFENAWIDLLLAACATARKNRDWSTYWRLRKYAALESTRTDVQELARQRVFPRLAYWLKDIISPKKKIS
jgi:glycosyltransferase involved in cell wall biosynthesis